MKLKHPKIYLEGSFPYINISRVAVKIIIEEQPPNKFKNEITTEFSNDKDIHNILLICSNLYQHHNNINPQLGNLYLTIEFGDYTEKWMLKGVYSSIIDFGYLEEPTLKVKWCYASLEYVKNA